MLLEHGDDLAWGYPKEVVEALSRMGHVVRHTGEKPGPISGRVASANAIVFDPIAWEYRGVVRQLPVQAGAVAGY